MDVSCFTDMLDHVSSHSFSENDDVSRYRALNAARRLCARLENPWDTIIRMNYLDVRPLYLH